MENRQLGIALLIIGLIAVNAIYLGDLLTGEPSIILGVKSGIGLIIANLVALAGLISLCRSGGEDSGSAGESAGGGSGSAGESADDS